MAHFSNAVPQLNPKISILTMKMKMKIKIGPKPLNLLTTVTLKKLIFKTIYL